MIYVEMLGRMGNQMFSYAHARYIQEKYPCQKIGIDFTNFEIKDDTWINYLQYFNCWKNVKMAKRKMNILQKIILKLFYQFRRGLAGYYESYLYELRWAPILELFGLYIFTNGYFPFKYNNFFRNKLLIGFFESDKYFLTIQSILKKEFKVTGIDQNEKAVKIIEKIDMDRAICAGVRKGDFAVGSNKNYCDICTPAYYRRGVELIKQRVKEECSNHDMKFVIYIFTDDVDWAKNNLCFENDAVYVTSSINGDIKPWEMLQIMTYFRYYVISNSSFFWWGQFLSQSDNPMVVAPNKWRSRDQELYKDIYEEGWLLLDPD